jgi:hypothetical protein
MFWKLLTMPASFQIFLLNADVTHSAITVTITK